MHHGQGPGLSRRDLGASGGSETVTLQASEVPSHSHTLLATSSATTGSPAGAALANAASGANVYRVPGATTFMATDTMQSVGGAPHNNRQPYLTLYFAIALQGVFPPRT
jgi:microcystin-dependent protein